MKNRIKKSVPYYKYIMDEWYTEWYTCCNCKKDGIARSFKFCPNCGLEIDWTRIERNEKVETERRIEQKRLRKLKEIEKINREIEEEERGAK